MDEEAVASLKCSKYPKCDGIEQHKIDVKLTDVQLEKFRQDYRVSPLFEQKMRDYVEMKRTSMLTNKLLACRWQERVCSLEVYDKKMFSLPRLRDFHFRNYHIRYLPDRSPDNSSNNRFHMQTGPGVDQYGQLPMPSDLPSVNRKPVCRTARVKSGRKKHECFKTVTIDCVKEGKVTKF